MAKLYARRMIETMALSVAAAAATRRAKTASALSEIAKPEEWNSGIDLEEQRRQFSETISSLGATKFQRLWAAGSRIATLSLLALPITILAPMAYIAGPKSQIHDYSWDYAVWAVEKAGPTFIKLIQWASTRNDLFSDEFVKQFSKLQDNTRGHSWDETLQVLERTFGPNHHELITIVDAHQDGKQQTRSQNTDNNDSSTTKQGPKHPWKRPIGSGCIAQVYRAKLQQDIGLQKAGSDIAIKVLHPHILHKVCVDFYILQTITSIMESMTFLSLDYLSTKDSVEQFRDIMLPQLDLRVEANNLKRFRRDFQDDTRIAFPAPLMDLTTNEVLVESYVAGEPIMELIRSSATNQQKCTVAERQELASIGLQTVMKMIFLNDFVHADLHPGNILVDRNTSIKGSPLRMNLIDCGLVLEMGEHDHVNLTKILGVFIKRDGLLAAQLMVDTAKKCQASPLDVKLFCQGIQKICDDDEERNFLESVGDYLAEICFLACRHKVKLEASFINAALACEIMEGMACRLHPELEAQEVALPVVFQAEVMHGLRHFSTLKQRFWNW